MHQERYAEAAAAFRDAVRLEPGEAWYHASLGNALFHLDPDNDRLQESSI
jgi:cytochrome c-type biogenesis protein CcmH/NrfG